jgi:hypothetical protein
VHIPDGLAAEMSKAKLWNIQREHPEHGLATVSALHHDLKMDL